MEQLIINSKAPCGTICPKQLELKGIFDLNVDDTIWEDIGLEEGMPAAPPPWLADEDMHAGIKALLECDHCIEEELSVHSLDFGEITALPDWGPSEEDILNFRNTQKIELEHKEWDEESDYSDSEHGEVDMVLIDMIDAVHLADTTQAEMMVDDQYLYVD
ncbi:hypothetical protein DXG01_003358 [Tephrocybe rancida]|nr:hypothetical protein DXG01_003358 [Tephrocybe rancida]